MKVRKSVTLLLVSIVISNVYWLSVSFAQTEFLNSKSTDPLAMLHSLFPFSYIFMVLFSLLCFACLFYEVENRYVHILLLIQFSLILWFTPYYLSGFSRITDSLWQTGIAKNLPEIAGGQHMMFSYYYKEYPGSYILNFISMKILGTGPFIYAQLVYPLFCIMGLVLLWYVFVSRLFTYRIAFISTLITLLAPIPPEVHVSPHSLGTLLALGSAILLVACRGRKSKVIGILLAFALITVHPISPLVLLILVIAPYIIKAFTQKVEPPFSLSGVLAILCGWFGWVLFHTSIAKNILAESIRNFVTLDFVRQLEMLMSKALHTGKYVFPEISFLAKIVDYSYLVIPLIFFCRAITHAYINVGLGLKKGVKALFLRIVEEFHYEELLMISIAFLSVVLSAVSVLASGVVTEVSFYLWERFFFYFTLAVSAYIGSNVLVKKVRSSSRTYTYAKVLVICWLAFVAVAYPMTQTHQEAYQSYSPSEDSGMRFLQSHVNLSGKTLSMFLPHQLASYVDPGINFSYHSNEYRMEYYLLALPVYNGSLPPDVLVFRRTEYFYVSHVYDKTFENNRYTQALFWIEGSCEFNKIYSSPTFRVYTELSNDSLPG